jgi:hypothetical protein
VVECIMDQDSEDPDLLIRERNEIDWHWNCLSLVACEERSSDFVLATEVQKIRALSGGAGNPYRWPNPTRLERNDAELDDWDRT